MAATVRASCEKCDQRVEWEVPLGTSIMRHLDKLILWLRNEHECSTPSQ